MPYIIISTQIRIENGPTLCGDENQDTDLMLQLGAALKEEAGQSFKHYQSPDPPRIVLDRLEVLGYKVVATSGCGQTIIWTLRKD